MSTNETLLVLYITGVVCTFGFLVSANLTEANEDRRTPPLGLVVWPILWFVPAFLLLTSPLLMPLFDYLTDRMERRHPPKE